MKSPHEQINESLKLGDLENYISEVVTIDQFKSKMGEDSDVLVLGFKVKEKLPATDLVEFFERAYDFVLDADTSAGEEFDGQYHVFVEIERTPEIIEQLTTIKKGLENLTNNKNWKFKYQKDSSILEFNKDNIKYHVPSTKKSYEDYLLKIKNKDIREFFNQGAADVSLNENNELIFNRPYAEEIKTKFVAIGDYNIVKSKLPGALDLSENSQSQILFLNKFLGNYDINKIGNKFIIRNNDQAIIIEKKDW